MASRPPTGVQTLEVPALELRTVHLRIVGDSELITHAWSEKARAQMRDKQMGKAQQKKEPKNPEEEYQAAFYRTADGTADGAPALPTIAFKAAAVNAATQVSGLTKTFLRGAFHVMGELVAIEGEPRMREDMVRIAMGTADIRYRPAFASWAVTLPLRYSTRSVTLEQIIHLFNQAGFSVGVGEWRPEKDGSYGMFHVESAEEVS